MITVIHGASDDLIEISGGLEEEFSTLGDEKTYVGLSNGVLLSMVYDQDGFWRINVLHHPAGALLNHFPARGEDAGDDDHGCPGYSDKVVTQDILWVLHSTQAARHAQVRS